MVVVVVEISDSDTAVIAEEGETAIELVSIELGANSKIDCVIKEGGNIARVASRAHPAQCPVRIDDARRKIAAWALNHDVVVTQLGANVVRACRIVGFLYPHGSLKTAVVIVVLSCFDEPSMKL